MIDVKITKLPDSEIEIEGEIPVETLEEHRQAAVKKLSSETKIPGFRTGHIPESVLAGRLGEGALVAEMAEQSFQKVYPDILAANGIDAIGYPEIRLTKLVPGAPAGFKIRVAVMPEVTLPDYKKIAAAIVKQKPSAEETEVSEKDVESVATEVRRRYVESKNDGQTPAPGEELPELSDDMVKEVGDFRDVADFKTRIADNLKQEKEHRLKEKRRLEIIEKIIEETPAELPAVLIESELDRMMAQFKGDISRMGLKPEEYLKHIKKTEEDLRTEWKDDAKKRVKAELVIGHISAAESIVPAEEEVNHEAEHLATHYKDVDMARIKAHVHAGLAREKVFEFLEGQK
jgi:FKBP-type peptidyl-prolyl cis-trans isomerase (trigger factor)